jgi:two-component system response regulator FixJ
MTVALIDDDAAVLDSLRMALSSQDIAVRPFGSAEAFLAAADNSDVTCVVSDVRMPGMSGLELQRALVEGGSSLPLILMTGHGDIAMAVQALKDGAFDFIEKPFDDIRLAESIRSAMEAVDKQRNRRAARAEAAARMAELTDRQRQVMELVVQGLSSKDIARNLGISPRTVENYRAWVMEKMGASNLADLVRKALTVQGED